ncbi:hypothetical protein ABH935_006416 [Catenulispora sp. GAS73]|uniref:hypothetical protein n=1 Tax=Catenulispora sp. GAS73 TaxID=3156269 RepID=UPI0035150F8C
MTENAAPRSVTPVPLPPIAEPFGLPFYCGALHSLGVDYLVDKASAAKVLGRLHPRLDPAEFDGRACVSINYMTFFAQYGDGSSITEEVEISIVAYPRGQGHRIATVSYPEYVSGVDQSKLLGIGRIHVLCDNTVAIEAGTKLFAEPKRPARFTANMPSLNGSHTDPWRIRVLDADLADDGTVTPGGELLFTIYARLAGLVGAPVNNTPVTGYGTDPEGRLLSSRLSVYHPFQFYPLNPETAKLVSVHVADRGSPVGEDLAMLIDGLDPAGAWTYQSPPVLAHNRPYYLP